MHGIPLLRGYKSMDRRAGPSKWPTRFPCTIHVHIANAIQDVLRLGPDMLLHAEYPAKQSLQLALA